MTDEELIRARIHAYMDDVVTFERHAHPIFTRHGDSEQQRADDDVLRRMFVEYQGRHRTRRAAVGITGMQTASPPRADWDRTTILSVTIDGARAVVVTDELVPGIPGPERYQYFLEKEDGEWRLADRWMYFEFRDPEDPDDPEWLKQML